jgi:uncharacterized C2H2 Zn-finger protein
MFDELANKFTPEEINKIRLQYNLPLENIKKCHTEDSFELIEVNNETNDCEFLFDSFAEKEQEGVVETVYREEVIITDEYLNEDDEEKMKDDYLFKCFECNLQYKSLNSYEKHLVKKHGKNEQKFICSRKLHFKTSI